LWGWKNGSSGWANWWGLALGGGNLRNRVRDLFRPVDWDVFVHDLNRQLGTPSLWLPVDSCKKEDKEAP